MDTIATTFINKEKHDGPSPGHVFIIITIDPNSYQRSPDYSPICTLLDSTASMGLISTSSSNAASIYETLTVVQIIFMSVIFQPQSVTPRWTIQSPA